MLENTYFSFQERGWDFGESYYALAQSTSPYEGQDLINQLID